MSMISEMLSYPFVVRALVGGILVSLCCALLGVSLVLKRYSMIGDGLSHVSFGALSIAVAAGWSPLKVSIPLVVLAAFFLLRITEHGKVKSDAAIAMISASSLAVGIIVTSLTTGMTTDVSSYMFGSILAMSREDVILSAVLSIIVLCLFVFCRALQRADCRADSSHYCSWHEDDGSHADLQPHYLPGTDRHADF